jgi:hypothetical protein
LLAGGLIGAEHLQRLARPRGHRDRRRRRWRDARRQGYGCRQRCGNLRMEKVHGAPARWQAELAAGSLMQASAKGPQREGGSRMADLRHGASSNSCPGTGDAKVRGFAAGGKWIRTFGPSQGFRHPSRPVRPCWSGTGHRHAPLQHGHDMV